MTGLLVAGKQPKACTGYSTVLVAPSSWGPEARIISHYDAVHSQNFQMNLSSPKTKIMGLSDGENLVILARFVHSQHRRVTDGRTVGIAMAIRR